MNEHEQDLFEAELRQLRPTKLPEEFANRLAAARSRVATRRSARISLAAHWMRLLRWLTRAAAGAVGLAALFIWLNTPETKTPEPPLLAAAPPVLRADDVEIDRQLISAFEAVATLPDGEPVRLRVREWMDEVVLRDTARGVAIQQRTPRFEVVPVSFETF